MPKNNECIEERDDSYRVKIAYYDEEGNRKFYSKSFSIKKYGTKQKALEFARKHRDIKKVELANGMIIKEKHYTLDEVFNKQMEIYDTTLATKKKVTGTYNKYIKSFIGGDRDFKSIKFDDIQKNLNSMKAIAKDDTIQRANSIWKRLYHYAVAKNIVVKDETYNVSTPKSDIITIKKPMVISNEDFMKALEMLNNGIKDKRESILIQGALLIMRFTGMRPSEVLGLERKNIDLDYYNIYVCQRVGTTSTESNVITHAKTEQSIRNVPIVAELIPVFEKIFEVSNEELLFTKNNGTLMNGTYLSDMCRFHTNGLLRPYMLRHQFSTDLLIEGTDIRTIQELMGHRSSSMTLEYARSNDELKRNALISRKFH